METYIPPLVSIQEMRDAANAQREMILAAAVDNLKARIVKTLTRDAAALGMSINYNYFVAKYLDDKVFDFDVVIASMKRASVDLHVSPAWLSGWICGTESKIHMSW